MHTGYVIGESVILDKRGLEPFGDTEEFWGLMNSH